MASPGQKRGGCGHIMAGFDSHNYCVCCHDKGKGPTPSYQLKKEKRDSKKNATPSKETSSSASVTLSPTLVDLAHVSVVGFVDGQGTVRSPGLSAPPAEKKKKVEDKKSPSESVKSDKSTKSASSSRQATVSTNHRIDEKIVKKMSTIG